MFIGREYELKKLNEMYQSNQFEMAVIYGRRRVGKTSLINEFCKEKKNIFYVAIEQNNQGALRGFSNKIFELYPTAVSYLDTFSSWESAFEYILAESKDERLIIAIDEYPYIASGYPSISSEIQNIIDHKFLNSKIFLILCGSSMSFMENQVLGYKSPLYGRRTGQFKIKPFDFFDSARFYDNYSSNEKLLSYAVTGGIPQYLKILSKEKDITESISKSFFSTDGYMFEEPSSLLKQELREPAVYNSIITAIANGASKLNQISTKSGENSKKCSKYLKVLIDIGIIKKEIPAGTKEGRNTIYSLTDNMFKFWYRYIPCNRTLIESEMGSVILKNKVLPDLPNYLGGIFEEVCKEYMIRRNKIGNLPFMFINIGRWWGNNPILKQQEEIDILAYADENVLLGECKWRNEKINLKVLDELIRKGNECIKYKNKYYILFSKTGFTDEFILKANKENNIELVTIDDIYGARH